MFIKIRVKTSSRKEEVERKTEESYKICVKEPAKDNRANTRILEIMRKIHHGKSVRITKGHHSPAKIVEVK